MKTKVFVLSFLLGTLILPPMPINAEVLVEEGMRDFSCADVGIGQKLRMNPVTGMLSTQAERRRMVETRLYVCSAYALAEAVPLVVKASGETVRDAQKRLLKSFPLAARVYANRIVKTLSGEKPDYALDGNPAYVWSYSAHMMRGIWSRLTKLNLFSLEYLSAEVFDFLKTKEHPHEHEHALSKETMDESRGAIKVGQTFFAESITEKQRAALETIERFHQEASDAILCKARTGKWCESGRPLPDIAADHDAATLAGDTVGLPRIVAFARGVNWNIPYPQLCATVKRIDHAHHLWMDGVLNGHTPEGFTQAWVSGLAHAILHFERRAGFSINPSGEFSRVKPEIRELLQMPVEGCA
ncbi:MAG: hypothetical protein G01um101466_667 [Parcubacteria group bacterium Gr01-1014_66]|nr:MAG: hypothetical protein G01um101466_667 [Parcubacteria group bacterium Gr01-1014_66]